METIPLMVRRLVATEQNCNFVHYYPSFCELMAAPLSLATSAFADSITADGPADETRAAAATAAAASANAAYKVVYDVMRVRDGRILFKQSYAERFTHSLALAAPAHAFPANLQQTLQERLQRYVGAPGVHHDGVHEQNLKIVAWLPDDDSAAAATSPTPVLFFLPTSSYPAEAMYHDGAKLGFLYHAHRVNPNAKVAQTALRDRANAYQKDNGIFEVLLVHDSTDHYLVPEGSRSNYVLQRRDGTWWCSAEEDILVGITLKTTCRVMEACGLGTVQHGKLTLKDVLECKSLYMLGTSPTIMPVQSVLLYRDDETRRCFEEAVRALSVDVAGSGCNAIVKMDNDARAELRIPVDLELAPRLRAQYFTEAASS